MFNRVNYIKLWKFKHIKGLRKKLLDSIMGVKQSNLVYNSWSEPSLEEMELLEKSTHLKREQIIDFYKNFIRDCPTGKMTKKIFNNMFSTFQPALKSVDKGDKYCEYVFKYVLSCLFK